VKRTKLEKEDKNSGIFYTIGNVSEITGVKPYILRYWEKEFPFLQPIKNKVGHRVYTRRDIFIIQNIKELLYIRGYSINGAKKLLWNILLGRRKNTINTQIQEIKRDLIEMLDLINQNL